VGGLIGGALAYGGTNEVQWDSFGLKVLVPLVSSPILGLLIGFGLMVLLLNLIGRLKFHRLTAIVSRLMPSRFRTSEAEAHEGASPTRINDRFRRLQVISAAYMALAHGSNDAQKTMGIMTLALYTAKAIPDKSVPVWVILMAA